MNALGGSGRSTPHYTSIIRSKGLSPLLRYAMPFVLLANVGAFIVANLNVGASVVIHLDVGDSALAIPSLFDFALANSVGMSKNIQPCLWDWFLSMSSHVLICPAYLS